VRVTESRRARWREYADEYADGSLARLVREAVEAYAQQDGNPAQSPTVDSEELGSVAKQLGSVAQQLDQLDDVGDRLTSIEDRLDAVESHVGPDGSVDAADVVTALPPTRPHTEKWLIAQGEYDGDGTVVWSGRPEDLADQFGVTVDRIRDALGRVEESPIEVQSAVENGHTEYWAPKQSHAADAVPSTREVYEYGRPDADADNRGESR
jgi:hypothetical protein